MLDQLFVQVSCTQCDTVGMLPRVLLFLSQQRDC